MRLKHGRQIATRCRAPARYFPFVRTATAGLQKHVAGRDVSALPDPACYKSAVPVGLLRLSPDNVRQKTGRPSMPARLLSMTQPPMGPKGTRAYSIGKGKTRDGSTAPPRPKVSGKNVFFPRNDRPHGLKRAALQTENTFTTCCQSDRPCRLPVLSACSRSPLPGLRLRCPVPLETASCPNRLPVTGVQAAAPQAFAAGHPALTGAVAQPDGRQAATRSAGFPSVPRFFQAVQTGPVRRPFPGELQTGTRPVLRSEPLLAAGTPGVQPEAAFQFRPAGSPPAAPPAVLLPTFPAGGMRERPGYGRTAKR